MRVAFMGTPEFAVPSLKRLHASAHQIVAVVTRPDRPRGRGLAVQPPPVKVCAEALGLPVHQPASHQDTVLQATLEELKPDCIAVVAYGRFLSASILDLPPQGCVNVHPSLLPAYRGAAPIQRAIMNGEPQTGVTIMYLSEEMDAGDIILQEPTPIGPDEDAGGLHDRLAAIGARLLVEALDRIEAGEAVSRPQDHAAATYAPKLAKDDRTIDWRRPARELHNQIRALSPQPGADSLLAGAPFKVWKSAALPGNAGAPGVVAGVEDESLIVQTGEGRLGLLTVQPAGGRRMSGRDFANGFRVAPGTQLG